MRDEWQLIGDDTPRDGQTVWLTAFEGDGTQFEVHPMQWMAIQQNGLFPGKTGMWTHPSGAYTWNDDGIGGGPTHWRAL